ncbi:MAG: M56 family metallopeptidase, partial [Sedimentisphaerales bacterium]|nr:M56 family metallopeptidase [Sedimentisphaerales bacterium]
MVEQINSIAQLWSSWMWPMFWQVSLLVVFIALADLFLRKRVWPQVRYALWLLVLIKLVIPPGFALSTSIVSQIRAHAPQKDTSSVVIELKSEEPSTFNIASENILPDVRPHIRPITFLEEERFALPAESTFQPYINSPVIVPEKIRFDWKAYLMIGWLAGVITLLFWAIMRYKALRKKFCTQIQKTNIPKWFEPLLNETAKRLKLRKIPQIAFSDNISSPAVFGTFKPVLILSSDISLSQKSMEHILLHELAHIKRLDLKVNTLTTLLQIVYWFNPLLFFTGKRLRHLRELCCDATVARILREQTSDYRMTIMESASRYFTKPTELGMGLLGLFEDSSSLANRLKWLEKKTWKYRTIQILTTIVVVTLMALYILPMAKAEKVQAAETSSSLSEENPEDEIDPKELISCTGNIVDNQGKPVEGAEITVYERFKQGSVILRQVGKTITSNTEGKFVFKTNSIVWIMRSFERIGELEQGLVVIQKDGFAIEWTSWDMNSDIDMNVTLTKPQSIDGIVIDETGESIPKAEVHAIVYKSKQSAADISNWLAGISPIEELQTTTDTQGKFKINNIPENSFVDVFVKAKDKAITCTYNNELGPAFKAGQTNIRAVLADEGRIEGKIIDLSTGKGVAGLKITVTPDKEKEGLIAAPQFSASYYNPLVCVSKEDGTFSIGELPEDKYILLGNFPSKNRVVVEKGKTTSDVTIECPAIVYGRVLGPDGKPYANADVQIRQVREPGNNGGIAAPNIKTDQFGNYLYADISWPYTMGVLNDEKFEDGRGYRGNYVKKKETFEGTQQVDFQLGNFPEGTANLAGEVKDQNNKPITEFIVQLNNKIKIEEKPGQSYSDFGITQIFYTTDGKFEFKNLPDGEYTVSLNSLQTNGQYEFPIFQETVLEKNKTTTVKYDIIKKQAYYGRVLFDDGTPAYFDPPPWPIASVTINVPSQIGGNRISVDKNGYFKAFLKDDQYESIKNGEFKMDISVPSLESERLFYSTRVSFPPDKLSTDKSRAGSIEIPKPSISLQLNPANAPSLLQQQIPDFNGIEINQNSEKEDNTNITIRGYVTDTLGRSRGNVYIAPETTNVWYGKRSDLQGHFVLEDVTPEQKKWVAYSQVSQAFGLFTIPDNYNGEPIHVTLDFVEASAEGRVIGEQGRGLPGQDVELVITTKDGLTYIFTSSQKTDLHGNYEFGLLPFGPGLKIQAKLTNTSENNKKYSTKAVNLSDNQIFVEMPTLVIGDAKPEQYDDGKILYSGRIINEQNQPVQGARVEMMYRW